MGAQIMKPICLLFAAANLIPLSAADQSGAVFWSASQMKAKDKELATKMDETKSGMDKIITMSNFNALNFHREGSGQSEVHEKFADFVIVRSGQGAILVGGTSRNAKPTTPGETRGEGVEGGTRYKLTPGDVLYIPAGVPHQMIVEKGKELNAMVIKIEAK
jgi:mannose-6-phosphate isomerase-like protein (cupin superfamily)